MTYLIALIIAIALGAVIALLSFTNIGSGFAGQSDKANAQQFANAVSQLEIATAAYEASSGVYPEDFDFEAVQSTLIANSWLRTELQVPSAVKEAGGEYSLTEAGQLSLSEVPRGVCQHINGVDDDPTIPGIQGLGCADGVATSSEISRGVVTPEVPED